MMIRFGKQAPAGGLHVTGRRSPADLPPSNENAARCHAGRRFIVSLAKRHIPYMIIHTPIIPISSCSMMWQWNMVIPS